MPSRRPRLVAGDLLMKNPEKGLTQLAHDPAWAKDRRQNRMSGKVIVSKPGMQGGEGGTEDPECTQGTRAGRPWH